VKLTHLEPSLLAEEVPALAEKYATMRALREAGGPNASRETLRELSARFPGSLAELDRLEAVVLEERAVESARLAAVAHERGTIDHDALPTWAAGWISVHRAMRGALNIKRRLGATRRLDEPAREVLLADIERDGTDEERALLDELDRIAAPPNGRLLDLVLSQVAGELGVAGDLRAVLMPRPRKP
jgi:hypothetical protein